MATSHHPLGVPFLTEGVSALTLHFNIGAIQSLMIKNDPEFLALGYTKTMIGFLLFQTNPKSISMIGFGGGRLPSIV
jgi:spermidine synthase